MFFNCSFSVANIEQRAAILALSWCCKSCRLRAILALNRARVLDASRQFFEPRCEAGANSRAVGRQLPAISCPS
jgi:hypothetical protein